MPHGVKNKLLLIRYARNYDKIISNWHDFLVQMFLILINKLGLLIIFSCFFRPQHSVKSITHEPNKKFYKHNRHYKRAQKEKHLHAYIQFIFFCGFHKNVVKVIHHYSENDFKHIIDTQHFFLIHILEHVSHTSKLKDK
jgi:hypothetical protein